MRRKRYNTEARRIFSTVVLLSLGLAACGGASRATHSASQATSTGTAPSGSNTVTVAATAGHLRGDEDDDDTPSGFTGSSKNDNDSDFDNDRKNENKGYYDSDDSAIRYYGHAAGAFDRTAITKLVKRYNAAIVADDGASACAMVYTTFAEALPEDYGQAPGPRYMRGAKTCQAVMTLLFEHSRAQTTGSVELTGVRVKGNEALALLGSRTRPAGYIMLKRERGAWKVNALLDGILP